MLEKNLPPQIYYLALSYAKNIGHVTAKQIFNHIGQRGFSVQDLFDSTFDAQSLGIKPSLLQDIVNPENLTLATKGFEFATNNGISVLCLEDPIYPTLLKECFDAPFVLFVKGNLSPNDFSLLSIVGTRNSTGYGERCIEEVIKSFAPQSGEVSKMAICSGLALGSDVAAHKAALQNGLPTFAVLAHGLNQIYPKEHQTFSERILEQGALITEYSSFQPPIRFRFLARNRIVAGLSPVTIISESDYKGGSINTAKYANEYNRTVFAFPGRMEDQYSLGCNLLIKNHLAEILLSPKQVRLEYPEFAENSFGDPDQISLDFPLDVDLDSQKEERKNSGPKSAKKFPVQNPEIQPNQTKKELPPLDEKETLVFSTLKTQSKMHLDEIALHLETSGHLLSPILLMLEVKGVIETFSGNYYGAKEAFLE